MGLPPPIQDFATILDALAFHARARSEAPAFFVEGVGINYGELYQDSVAIAGGLMGAGLLEGGHCAIALPTSVGFLTAFFGVQWAGAAPVAINPALPVESALRRARAAGSALLLCPASSVDDFRAAAGDDPSIRIEPVEKFRAATRGSSAVANSAPEAIAYLQITSGTTGEPRAAMVTHRSLMAFLRSTVEHFAISERDIFVSWLPLYHDMGLVRFIFLPLFAGCPCHLIAPSIRNLGRWLQIVSNSRATITAAPDFGFRIATRTVRPDGLDLSSLRIATDGGEPVRGSTIDAFEVKFGLKGIIRPAYGLAEATLGVAALVPGETLRTDSAGNVSCGRACPGIEIRIVTENSGTAQRGEQGEVLVRGEAVFSGYFGDDEATRDVLRDGWLHTGDIGSMDRDGHLYILGRKRAMIKRAGAMIAPREVEEAVDRIPGVRFSAAVGVAREALGGSEELVLVVEVHDADSDSAGDRAALARRISAEVEGVLGFAPGEVLLVPPRAIPRTQNGKIRYPELRRMVGEGTLSGMNRS